MGTLLFVRDEVLFVLFRAMRESQVRAVGELARLPFDRVAESLLDLVALGAWTPQSEEQVMNGHPDDFEAFRASRSRFFDSLAADSLLFNIERAATQEAIVTSPIVMEGELTILSGEGRLVLDHSTASERDVSEALRDALGLRRRGPGVERVGPVRITVDRLAGPRGEEWGVGR